MARDRKLNAEQQTPAQLKKKIKKLLDHRKELEKLEAILAKDGHVVAEDGHVVADE